jgi:hypothetical protein
MKRRTLLTIALAAAAPALTGGGNLLAFPPPPFAPPISGVVRSVELPVSGALVIFYNLADASLARARTAADGTFVITSVPVGVYDLIAYKKGFLPALVRLWHQASAQQPSSISIELAAAGKAALASGKPAPDVWELRDRLPADVLREINLADAAERGPSGPARERLNTKMAGEVRTVTDVAPGDTSLSRAAVGVRGGLPNGWSYALQGDYAAVSDGHGSSPDAGTTTGNSAGLALDVAPSDLDHVHVMTRRNQISFGDQGPASFQTHQVTWDRGDEHGTAESVGARYIQEAGLYSATARGTSLFPVASRTWELQAAYGRAATDTPGISVAMTYRRRESSAGPSGVSADGTFFLAAPDADLSAATSVRLGSKAQVEGGVVARYLAGGYGIAPRAVARYEIAEGAFVFVKGLYRVAESGTSTGTALPRVASIDDSNDPASRRSLAVGFERRADEGATVRVQASQQRMDEVVRSFFDGDLLTDFDSVYLMSGNTVRQLDASVQHRLTEKLAGSVSMRYGSIDGAVQPEAATAYGILDSRGRFWTARAGIEVLRTKTGVALVLRGVRQNLVTPASSLRNDSDKIAVSLSQDLSVVGLTPFGSVCRLLVALESSRNTRLSEKDDAPLNKRLLGGVAVSF